MNLDALWRRIMSCDKIVVPDNAAFTGGSRDDFLTVGCSFVSEDKELRLYLERAAQWTRYDGDFWATFFLVDRTAERPLLHHKVCSILPFDLSSAGPDSLYAGYARSIKSLDLGTWSRVNRDYGGYQDLVVAKRI